MMIRVAAPLFAAMALFSCSGCLAPVLETGTVDSGAMNVPDAGSPPDGGVAACRSYQWRGASITGPFSEGRVLVRQLSKFGDDWFELPLNGNYNLVGSRGAGLSDWRGERTQAAVRGLELILPTVRGNVVVNEFGIGDGCRVLSRSQALIGPFGAERLEITDSWELLVMGGTGEILLRF